MMKKQVLFIHGGGAGAHAEDKLMAANLQEGLGAAYQVQCPQMPGEDSPKYSAWRDQIHKELSTLHGEALLVGHSLGASVLLKYLSEETVEKPIAGLFLIATPYWNAEDWGVKEYALADNFAETISPTGPIFLYHSRTDEIVPFSHLARYAEQLPQATTREFDGLNHQLNNDLSVVAEDISSLPTNANR